MSRPTDDTMAAFWDLGAIAAIVSDDPASPFHAMPDSERIEKIRQVLARNNDHDKARAAAWHRAGLDEARHPTPQRQGWRR